MMIPEIGTPFPLSASSRRHGIAAPIPGRKHRNPAVKWTKSGEAMQHGE
jgi:hypothetical protein